MKKKKKIHEGKVKKVYSTADSEKLIQEFKDEVVLSDSKKKTTVKGKGAINNKMSAQLFKYLEGFNVPTHFIKTLGERDMLVKVLDMIPVKFVMRNLSNADFSERYGIEKGEVLKSPVLEFYLKDEERDDPMINQSHIIAFDFASSEEMRMIERMTSKINAVLKSYFSRRQVRLVDFKVEFGRYKDKIVLGDEISGDTCHFWDMSSGEDLDNDVFSLKPKNIENAFQEIENRILQ